MRKLTYIHKKEAGAAKRPAIPEYRPAVPKLTLLVDIAYHPLRRCKAHRTEKERKCMRWHSEACRSMFVMRRSADMAITAKEQNSLLKETCRGAHLFLHLSPAALRLTSLQANLYSVWNHIKEIISIIRRMRFLSLLTIAMSSALTSANHARPTM